MKKKLAVIFAPVLLLCSLFCPLQTDLVLAGNYDSKYFSDCNGDSDQIICTIILIFNWLAVGVATIVVIMIVVGAIQYMTAAGSQEQAKKGISTIKNAILALFLYMLMWAIVNFIVPGGVFG